MTSSNGIRTRHRIRRFIHRLYIPGTEDKNNTGQTPGTTAEGERKNMDKSEGSALLTVETLKTFYCCIESP